MALHASLPKPFACRIRLIRYLSFFISLTVCLMLCFPSQSQAQEPVWTVLPMVAEGVDPSAADMFRDLLESELMSQARARFVRAPNPCHDVECARAAGAYTMSVVVVYGSLRPLGAKIVAQVTMVEAPSGRVISTANVSASSVEHIDTAARDLAKALMGSSPTMEPAQPVLPPPPPSPAPPERAQDSFRSGFLMRFAGVVPLDDHPLADLGTGLAFDTGVWIEGDSFAIEPRIGLRFDAVWGDNSSYFAIPLDVGAFFTPNLGDISPFIGAGLGLRYASESRSRDVQLGSTIVTEHRGVLKDRGVGFATYGRAGIVFLRTKKNHLIVHGDYDVAFIELTNQKTSKSFLFGLAFVL